MKSEWNMARLDFYRAASGVEQDIKLRNLILSEKHNAASVPPQAGPLSRLVSWAPNQRSQDNPTPIISTQAELHLIFLDDGTNLPSPGNTSMSSRCVPPTLHCPSIGRGFSRPAANRRTDVTFQDTLNNLGERELLPFVMATTTTCDARIDEWGSCLNLYQSLNNVTNAVSLSSTTHAETHLEVVPAANFSAMQPGAPCPESEMTRAWGGRECYAPHPSVHDTVASATGHLPEE